MERILLSELHEICFLVAELRVRSIVFIDDRVAFIEERVALSNGIGLLPNFNRLEHSKVSDLQKRVHWSEAVFSLLLVRFNASNELAVTAHQVVH